MRRSGILLATLLVLGAARLLWTPSPIVLEDNRVEKNVLHSCIIDGSASDTLFGLVVEEDPNGFVSVNTRGWHFFHFLEVFLLVWPHRPQWIYHPLLHESELRGDVNGALVELFWGPEVQWFGLQSNDPSRRHPAYHGMDPRRHRFFELDERVIPLPPVESTWTVNRSACQPDSRFPLWTNYTAFPRDMWHNELDRLLPISDEAPSICYIDRQNTQRHLPPGDHRWLVDYLQGLPLPFQHLHMEDLSPFAQFTAARSCRLLVGVHGNGLSHMIWMPPRSTVVEFFYGQQFRYDYATLAQLMGHTYLAMRKGRVVNGTRIAALDPDLPKVSPLEDPPAIRLRESPDRQVLEAFIETQIRAIRGPPQ